MRPALATLRRWLTEHNLDGFILPRADQYLGEYVAPHDEMLAWLTGFTGSAGYAVVTSNAAWLYTDGRYQVQAENELQGSGFILRHSGRDKFDDDLTATQHGGKLAFDPWLHSIEWQRQMAKKFGANWELQPLLQNPVDTLWTGRPAAPMQQAFWHPIEFTGETSTDKCQRLGKALAAQNISAEFINDPTLTAWLLNLRGSDLPHTPIAQARALLHATGAVELFIDPRKLPPGAPEPHIVMRGADEIVQSISALGGKTIRLPANNTPYALLNIAEAAGVVVDTDASVIIPARARKNSTELEGIRRAHLRDAKAMQEFLKALPGLIMKGSTENDIALALAGCRAKRENYTGESFPAIVGWNGNGAIVHYRAPETSSAKISGNGILLIDSGGQYRDGTTDITRTLAIGAPTQRQREVYTRVLKGHLAIARAQFPIGTTGHQLDALARQYLWEMGLDYDHGTGHGVGCFLSVHEGPQSISNRHNPTRLEAGMILSNEPGCYLPGEFGVRIENLVAVVQSAQNGFLCFETLTFVPYDETLIDNSLLTAEEQQQISFYHHKVAAITA